MVAHPSKNIIQTISLIVGFVLTVVGAAGIFYPSFGGMHLSTFHSTIVALAGITLFYNGYHDNERNSFLACLCFGLYFLFHALAGFAFGTQNISTISDRAPYPELLRMIPNFTELGIMDHVMNGIIGIVLMGGALDWWRINHERRRWNRHDRRRDRYNRLAHR